LNVMKSSLTVLLTVSVLTLTPGCGQSKGPHILGVLPSPILTTHRPPKKEPIETVSKPILPAYQSTSMINNFNNVPAEWIPHVADNSWEAIVVHHSASDVGGAKTFDVAHRARGWDELGYHFVIGNGTTTPDGYVEVGSRWKKQKHGAHCKTPTNFYNDFGIGICLVGDFDQSRPTQAQIESLHRLIAYLSQRYHISSSHIYGHREARGTHTNCPGKYFPMADLRYWASCNNPIWASSAR